MTQCDRPLYRSQHTVNIIHYTVIAVRLELKLATPSSLCIIYGVTIANFTLNVASYLHRILIPYNYVRFDVISM